MRNRFLSVFAVLFVTACGLVIAEDSDVAELQARLAAQDARIAEQDARMADQDARMHDMQAKFGKQPESQQAEYVTSLKKNARVTLGGLINTRYYYRQATVDTALAGNQTGSWAASPTGERVKREDMKLGDLSVYDAKVTMQIEVNDHFDGYIKLSLHDAYSRRNVSGVAQNYWMRWKNICNSGFGVLVGRNNLAFGDNWITGVVNNYTGGQEGLGDFTYLSELIASPSNVTPGGAVFGDGMFLGGSLTPYHTGFDFSRTTQINPYWENSDGSFRAEVSLMQGLDRLDGDTFTFVDSDGVTKSRAINYGLGSGTFRLIWKPIEGLKLTASALNYRQDADRIGEIYSYKGNGPFGDGTGSLGNGIRVVSNNSAVNLAFQYRPAAFKRLNTWGQWVHGWNEGWVKDMDSDSFNFGASFAITDNLLAFAQGDYLQVENRQSDTWNKGTGWAVYTGMIYTLSKGLSLEAGWRHERIAYSDRSGYRHTKIRGNTVYGNVGFGF